MAEVTKPLYLNLGCGTNKVVGHGWVNVDAYGSPDVFWDLNVTPYPWADYSVDNIQMFHILEHLDNWWSAFTECARILKVGGTLNIHVPDESSRTALTYRDHLHVFSPLSFHGIDGSGCGTNSWAFEEANSVPLRMDGWSRVPFKQYEWMIRWCPWLLTFCADHLRNFIWEQRFEFRKIR